MKELPDSPLDRAIYGTREEVDYSGLTLDSQQLPVVYVDSKIVAKSSDSGFASIIQALESAPKPGFYLTPKDKGDKNVRVRRHLNRHCILQSELFRDSDGVLYRDVDAKGVGYLRGFPMSVVPTCVPWNEGDYEVRGILHEETAQKDGGISRLLASLGVRVARHVAHIELFNLVNEKGEIVSREELGKEIGANLEKIKPYIAIRAQGTTARVWDCLFYEINGTKNGYIREVLDDAREFVSIEQSRTLTPEDYAVWFYETFATQLAIMHSNNIYADFHRQAHAGAHNVTLDCRFIDTFWYCGLSEEATEKDIFEAECKNTGIGADFILRPLSDTIGKIYGIDGLHKELLLMCAKIYKSKKAELKHN